MAAWWFALLACSGTGDPSATSTSTGPEPTDRSVASGESTTAATGLPVTSWPTGMPTAWWAATGCSTPPPTGDGADVVEVSATGGPSEWTVSVTVRSPDTGCEQYADWWELVTPSGELVARRILNHSHVDEQPFTRASEGPISVEGDAELVVRAHLHVDGADPEDGYGGEALQGTLAGGFDAAEDTVPAGLATQDPLPAECWY